MKSKWPNINLGFRGWLVVSAQVKTWVPNLWCFLAEVETSVTSSHRNRGFNLGNEFVLGNKKGQTEV
jgi:hypothetical protein